MTNDLFTDALSLLLLRMNDQQAADLLGVSRPTVVRWRNGKNLPYRLARKPVLDRLREHLASRGNPSR